MRLARQAWLGRPRHGSARPGLVWQARPGPSLWGTAWPGLARQAGLGRRGELRTGGPRPGSARPEAARRDRRGVSGTDRDWHTGARRGRAWQAWHSQGEAGLGRNWTGMAWQGWARQGATWLARQGMARQGADGHRLGTARRGKAEHG
jgi:hypothetical protein